MVETDEELLVEWQDAKCQRAARELWKRYANLILGVGRRLAKNSSTQNMEDLRQEVFVKVLGGWDRSRGTSFKGYLKVVLVNSLQARGKKEHRRIAMELEAARAMEHESIDSFRRSGAAQDLALVKGLMEELLSDKDRRSLEGSIQGEQMSIIAEKNGRQVDTEAHRTRYARMVIRNHLVSRPTNFTYSKDGPIW